MLRIIPVLVALLASSAALGQALTVAAAVSLKDALTQIAADRTAEGKGEINFVFGSSGQLQQQILNGAPVDVFISAGVKQMDDLAAASAIDAGARRDVAGNELVLIAPVDSKLVAESLATLDLTQIKRLAIGEPRTVPAGMYAFQALKSAGVESPLADRIIAAANVRQVLSYVERGEVSAGVVYASDAMVSGNKVRVVLKIDPRLHDPIVYPAAVVAKSANPAAAKAFLEELTKAPAQQRLAQHGFTPAPISPATQPAR